MGISPRYPPVTGRLHTRYAPVRRSPAVYCYTPLPLDLHVLSLPLAFILSQDQTLHCKNCLFILPLTRLVSPLPPRDRHRTHAISMSQNFYVLSFPGQLPTGGVFLESGCKDTTFFQTAKIFFQLFFTPPHHRADNQRVASIIFFSQKPQNPQKSPRKRRKKSFFPHVFGVAQGDYLRKSLYIVVYVWFKYFQILRQQNGRIRYHSVSQCIVPIFVESKGNGLFCPHTGKPVVRHASRAHPRTPHHGLGSIPIRVDGRLGGITGHTAA